MTDDVKILKECLAKGPTPGPWDNEVDWEYVCSLTMGEDAAPVCGGLVKRDSNYIAACSPDRISRILEQLEAYEGALKILGRYHGGDGSITRELASEQFAVVAKYAGEGE